MVTCSNVAQVIEVGTTNRKMDLLTSLVNAKILHIDVHNIIHSCGVGLHELGICHLYYMGPSNKLEHIHLSFIISCRTWEIWVELHSRHYAQELIFIPKSNRTNTVHPI